MRTLLTSSPASPLRTPLLALTGLALAATGGLATATVSSAPADAAVSDTAPGAPTRLTVDDQAHPLNLEGAASFGWLPQDPDANEVQTAYEIKVADAAGTAVWDSGKTTSSQESYVDYAGTALSSGSAYTWSVRTWDRADQASPWAADATFETGLGDADWEGAQWIKRAPGNPDAASGPLSIVSGRLKVTGGKTTLVKGGADWTDYTLEAEVTPTTGGAGLTFRNKDASNGYMWQLSPGSGLKTYVQKSAKHTQLGATVPLTITAGTTYDVKIVVTGSTFTTTIDGQPAGTVTDTTYATGTVGVREDTPESDFVDDYTVTATDGTSLFSDDFSGDLSKWAPAAGASAQEPDEWTLARKEVTLPAGQIVRARSYVAASHTFELWLNGQRADRGSSFTPSDGEGYYQAADVTKYLTAGQPLAIGSVLHWYSQGQGRYKNSPGLLVRLVVQYADGSEYDVTTDGTWQVRRGPYLTTSTRNGEGDYIEALDGQAQAAIGDWTDPGYTGTGWSPAVVIGGVPNATFGHLTGQQARLSESVVHPVRMLTAADGTPVADFGTIIPARPAVHLENGVAGRVLTIRASDRLDATTGRVATDSISTQGTTMTFPYTEAAGAQDYQAFTHLAFRYLEIPGAAEDISADDVTATIVHTAVPDDGAATFSSSDPVLDSVFDLMQRSALYSAQETFVDTPTREKGQFLGDTINISDALMGTEGERVHSRQAIQEFLASQRRYWTTGDDAGRYNAVYPNGDGKRDIPDYTEMFPGWVWRYYEQTGDTALLRQAAPSILATADYVRRHIAADGPTQGLVTNLTGGSGAYLYGIIDWPEPGRFGYDMTTAARTVVNALGVDVLRSAAEVARATGSTADVVAGLTSDADALAARMNATLRKPDGTYVDGLLADGTQSTHAGQHASSYPLAFGIVPAADRAGLAAKVGAMGMKQGPMTAHWLLRGLEAGGDGTDVLKLLTNQNDLGWAKILADGGTFTYEEWVPDSSGNSLSHGWGAQSVVDITDSVLGIKTTAPGASRVSIGIPQTGLQHAAGSVMTQRGRVSSDWSLAGGGVSLTATVPVNVAADVALPALPAGYHYAARSTTGVTVPVAPSTDGLVHFAAGSGTWSFTKTADTTAPVPVTDQATTTTTAKLLRRPTSSAGGRLLVHVKAATGTPTGKVVVRITRGGRVAVDRKAVLDHGRARIGVHRLPKGRWTVRVTYSGDDGFYRSRQTRPLQVRQ